MTEVGDATGARVLDRLFRRPEAILLAMAVALGAAACGGAKHNSSAPVKVPQRSNPQAAIKVSYFVDGSRFLEPDFAKPNNDNFNNYSGILEWCDGGNLLIETSLEDTGAAGGVSSIAVSPNDPKCVDGRLTPSDFAGDTSGIESP